MIDAGLPREARGSEATTRPLLQPAGPLPPRSRVVDIGCGTGPATLALARLTGGDVTGVDVHEPYLARLRTDADTARIGERVRTLGAPMADLPLPDASFDLLWAEGSAYVLGFDAALRAGRGAGCSRRAACSCSPRPSDYPDPAPGARAFWDAGYPGMRSTGGNVAAAQDLGYGYTGYVLVPRTPGVSRRS